jgi:kynureninase
MSARFAATLEFAQEKDREDPLRSFRDEFYFPRHGGKGRAGKGRAGNGSVENEAIYFCGNSLGLQPRSVQGAVMQELTDWQDLAIDGYKHGKTPWLFYQHHFRRPLSAIVGCMENEVTVMNALTVNLHLLMLSFYRPDKRRYRIIMEAGAFPSDQYAIETQIRFHGLDPSDAIVEIHPRDGEKVIREEDIMEAIEQNKDSLALVLFGGINYYTGQYFDIPAITTAAHGAGAIAGFDLAHVAGNIPVQLHDWEVDFAVWCSYKYLNAGPGAVGGAYIHEQYAQQPGMIRLGGWWGNEESTRFRMEKGFVAKPDASGWNLSTAQVFNMVALKASLELFQSAGMAAIRAKSVELTAYLEFLLYQLDNISFEILTPSEPERRGAQLSLFFREKGKEIHAQMNEAGIVVDYREPGVVRVAPAPLYNSFEDVHRFYHILEQFQ